VRVGMLSVNVRVAHRVAVGAEHGDTGNFTEDCWIEVDRDASARDGCWSCRVNFDLDNATGWRGLSRHLKAQRILCEEVASG
jgi:hypothetical protein